MLFGEIKRRRGKGESTKEREWRRYKKKIEREGEK
jgi:hypothetical protein